MSILIEIKTKKPSLDLEIKATKLLGRELPKEVFFLVAELLDIKSLSNLSLVCRGWIPITAEADQWKKTLKKPEFRDFIGVSQVKRVYQNNYLTEQKDRLIQLSLGNISCTSIDESLKCLLKFISGWLKLIPLVIDGGDTASIAAVTISMLAILALLSFVTSFSR